MLDLIFLIMFIVIIFRSLRGYYNEKLCKAATIIGVIAAIVGIIYGYFVPWVNSPEPIFNVLVMGIAIAQRYAARHLAKLYNEKIEQARQALERDIEMHSRKRDGSDYQIAEADFDNEEIRFGKGGFKPYNEVDWSDDENITLKEGKK